MNTDLLYAARPITRQRATQAEMEERRRVIEEIVTMSAPASVRHIYYLAVTRHLVQKDTGGSRSNYNRVQRAVLDMRRSGRIDYADIVDTTRWLRKPSSWSGVNAYLESVQRSYRRDLWARQGVRLEVWCESESIAGVLLDVTSRWDVPLLPSHGYSSETFAWGAADNWRDDDREPVVLYVGDLDLHGKQIEADLRRKLEGFYGSEIEWTRVGITEEQIENHNLGDLATKEGHWEAEALPPDIMRDELTKHIEIHVSDLELQAHLAAEKSERDILRRIVAVAQGGAA